MRRLRLSLLAAFAVGAALAWPGNSQAQPTSGKKPNILVIWGDDIGTWNISHNSRGMMGYRAIATSISPPCMGSTNTSAASIT